MSLLSLRFREIDRIRLAGGARESALGARANRASLSRLVRAPLGRRRIEREWRNGRRAGFRCQCPQGRGGSNPPSRTHHPRHRARSGTIERSVTAPVITVRVSIVLSRCAGSVSAEETGNELSLSIPADAISERRPAAERQPDPRGWAAWPRAWPAERGCAPDAHRQQLGD